MKKIILLFVFLMTTNAYTVNLNSFLPANLIQHKEYGNSVLLKSFKIKTQDTTHYTLTLHDNESHLIDIDFQLNVDEFTSTSQLKNFETLIKLAYSDKPSPYAGIISNSTKCKKEFFPKKDSFKIKDEKYLLLVSTAGDRFQYGICDKSEATYQVCSLIHYFPKKEMIMKLKYFAPYKKSNCKDGLIKFVSGLELK
jgi:hypothetical protein